MDDERTSITDVGQMADEFEFLNETLTSFASTFDSKREDSASSTRQIV